MSNHDLLWALICVAICVAYIAYQQTKETT